MAMAWFALGNHAAIQDVEGGKERGGAMAEVVVSDTFDVTQAQGQHRLGAFERLDLAFFVDTQDQGVIWGIEVKAHDVAHLFHEERVGGEFEALGAMRLESEELEVAAHRALGNPGFFGDQAHTPVGGALGFGVQDAIDQCRHLLIAMGGSAKCEQPRSRLQTGLATT